MSVNPNEGTTPEREPASYAVPASKPAPETEATDGYPAPPVYKSAFDDASAQSSAPAGYGAPAQQYVPSGYVAPQPPSGYSQPSYQQAPPASPYAQQHQYPVQGNQEGKSASTLSMVFGILGVIVLPLIFAPLALWQASKAEKLGTTATAGKVLGYIGLAFCAFQVLYFGFRLMSGI